MQPKYEQTDNGQEVGQTELNGGWRAAALADDFLLAELLRLPWCTGVGQVAKAVLPFGIACPPAPLGSYNFSPDNHAQILLASGIPGYMIVTPFRAIIGSRTLVTTNGLDGRMDIRSAIYAPETGFGLLPIPTENDDIEIYAVVSIDAATPVVTRYGRDSGGVVGSQNVVVSRQTTITLGMVNGSMPADVAGVSYTIHLGTIPGGYNGTDILTPDDFWEDAPIVPIHPAMGIKTARPAGYCFASTGTAVRIPWTAGQPRPAIYLPPSMQGGASLWLPLKLYGTPSVADGDVVDNSEDWRHRFFEWSCTGEDVPLATDTSVDNGAWDRRVPCAYTQSVSGMGQSMISSTGTGDFPDHRIVAHVDHTQITGMGNPSSVTIRCDNTGRLVVDISGTPGVNLLFSIHASTAFHATVT
jgi:hypothetical protein